MAKYLVKNVDEYRTVGIGRLRFTPGRQMWIDAELFSHSKVQSLVQRGALSVLQIQGLPEPEVLEAAPAEVQSAPAEASSFEPSETPALEPAPPALGPVVEEEEEEEEEEDVQPLKKSQLTHMRVAALRELAESRGVSWLGLRKAELISALLGEEEE